MFFFCFAEPAISSLHCERQNGYFEHEDPTVCDEYYECVHGVYNLRHCHEGLVFDKNSGSCKWAKSKVRTGCKKREPGN